MSQSRNSNSDPAGYGHAGVPRGNRAANWAAAGAGFLVLVVLAVNAWRRFYPPIPQPLHLRVVFPAGSSGAIEPLVCTGRFGKADYLSVRYVDATDAVFTYDTWGMGGPTSASFSLHPGTARELVIEMPSLAQLGSSPHPGPLHVFLDGRELLATSVSYYSREDAEVYFGINPVGGSPAAEFRGHLSAESGRPLNSEDDLFAASVRIRWLAKQHWQYFLWSVLVATLSGYGARRATIGTWARRLVDRFHRPFAGRAQPCHVTFAIVAFVCIGFFAGLITGGSFRLVFPDSFGTFFDYQAVSLLHGRLDVPEPALSGEAFHLHGKYYGYFGITPALLRLPFAAAHLGFGKLTRPYMLVDFAACLVAAYFLLCQATRRLCGRREWPSGFAVALFVGGVGLGSSLLFLGSRAYVYHEATLAGAAFALWSTYYALKYLNAPESRAWIPSLACGLLSIHARPPTGLFALCLLGTVALAHLIATALARRNQANPKLVSPTERNCGPGRHLAIGVGAFIGILSFNGLSYAKFGTFDGAPLQYHVQYTPQRLAHFEGKNFHLSNFHHNFDAYIWAPDYHFERHFPWIFIGGSPRPYPHAEIDVDEPTLGIPYAMPALCALVLGGAWAAVNSRAAKSSLFALTIAVVPMALALFTAIATSQRYTADACPYLIAAAAWGAAALDCDGPAWRRSLLWAGGILTAISIFVTVALAEHNEAAVVWGVPDQERQNLEQIEAHIDRWFGVH